MKRTEGEQKKAIVYYPTTKQGGEGEEGSQP